MERVKEETSKPFLSSLGEVREDLECLNWPIRGESVQLLPMPCAKLDNHRNTAVYGNRTDTIAGENSAVHRLLFCSVVKRGKRNIGSDRARIKQLRNAY